MPTPEPSLAPPSAPTGVGPSAEPTGRWRLGRRSALMAAGGGVALLAGCESSGGEPSARRTVQGEGTDPDVALAAATLAALDAAGARLDEVHRALPGLRQTLRPARGLVVAHRDLLREAVPDAPTTPSPSAGATGGTPPADAAAGRRILRAELRRLPALLTEQSVRARSGAFAQVLAQMGAAYAQAGYELGGRR